MFHYIQLLLASLKQNGRNRDDEKDEHSKSGAYQAFSIIEPDIGLDVVARDMMEDIRSIRMDYESGGADSHNNEAAYELVGFQDQKVSFHDGRLQSYNQECLFVDQQTFNDFYLRDENRQVTSLDSSLSGSSPQNSTPFSTPPKVKSPGRNQMYRSFRKTLRTSFRKGREFIRNEKIVTLFDRKEAPPVVPKPPRSSYSLDVEYKRNYNSPDAEKIYQNWVNKPKRDGVLDLHERQMLQLIEEITTQRKIKQQLKNALSVCRNSKEFDSSSELVEAERLLLVSNLKEAAAKKCLIDYERNQYSNPIPKDVTTIGTVSFSDFEFQLKGAALHDTLYNYFYVCVATYRHEVRATLAKERDGSVVYFSGAELKFFEVDSDYEIRVEVFALSLRKNNHGAAAEPSRFQSIKNAVKLSPKRFFHGEPAPGTPKVSKVLDHEFSEYKSQGFTSIKSDSFYESRHGSNFDKNFQKSGSHYVLTVQDYRDFKLTMVYNSHLEGKLQMAVKSDVLFKNTELQGWLTVAVNTSGAWDRR